MSAQGWYKDPYGIHDDRWISDGIPTKLVRDAGNEHVDPPPNYPAQEPFTRADSLDSTDYQDTGRRASKSFVNAVLDVLPQGTPTM